MASADDARPPSPIRFDMAVGGSLAPIPWQMEEPYVPTTRVPRTESNGDPRKPMLSVRLAPSPFRPRSNGWWRIHQETIRRWITLAFASAPPGYALKTDLFDEASGPYHHAFDLPPHLRFLGIDVDRSVSVAAFRRIRDEASGLGCVVGDIRHPPLRRGSVSAILSLSTLDHLPGREEIRHALTEIHRLLCPGGILLLTLDNPANPEVSLRAHLPSSIVRRLRADAFPLGQTLSLDDGTRMLNETGFLVRHEFHMGHAVRYPTVRAFGALERRLGPSLMRRVERVILAMEVLARTPLALLTGHYVGWIAVKAGAVANPGQDFK